MKCRVADPFLQNAMLAAARKRRAVSLSPISDTPAREMSPTNCGPLRSSGDHHTRPKSWD